MYTKSKHITVNLNSVRRLFDVHARRVGKSNESPSTRVKSARRLYKNIVKYGQVPPKN